MEECLNKGIMMNFIREHGSEVMNMLFTEFNMEDALEVRGEERYEDGLADGRAAGIAEGKAAGIAEGKAAAEIHMIRHMISSGIPSQSIANLMELEEACISQIAALCTAYPEMSDAELAERLQHPDFCQLPQ